MKNGGFPDAKWKNVKFSHCDICSPHITKQKDHRKSLSVSNYHKAPNLSSPLGRVGNFGQMCDFLSILLAEM